MIDLHEQASRVYNPDVRPTVAEAVRAYGTGSPRASIILTWSAVCADLIFKIERLADDGDGKAQELSQRIANARTQTGQEAVTQMQSIERSLLDEAFALELIDELDKRELVRLKEDRNLCAHPSLRPLGDFFVPTEEYARAHLASALRCLLTVPPSQGRRAVERFLEHVASTSFTDTPGFIARTFHDHVKPATQRRIVDVAVKHAMLELDAPEDHSFDPAEIAGRMAVCVHAFAARNRQQVAERIQNQRDRFAQLSGEQMLRALGRLGDLDVFREAVGEETQEKINALISDAAPPLDEDLLSLVALDDVRATFPSLEESFDEHFPTDQAQAVGRRPSPYFTEYLSEMLRGALTFRTAEAITAEAVLPCARFLTIDHLKEVLHEWATNDQCRMAAAMPRHAVALHEATDHLRPGDQEVWKAFVQRVQEEHRPPDYYAYEELAEAVDNDGS